MPISVAISGKLQLTNWLSSTRSSEVVSATHRTNDFLPFVGGLVFDALGVGSLISALIRLEFCSAVLFVKRFQATANGKSPMCIIMVEALRRKCGHQNYLVLAGAVRNAYPTQEQTSLYVYRSV